MSGTRVVAALACVAFGCGGPQPSVGRNVADEVVAYLNYRDFPLQTQQTLGDLVDMQVFADLRPEETLEQVRKRHGEPIATRADHRGTFYVYRIGGHEVALAHLVAGSTFGGDWEDWSPYAYPANCNVEAVFRGELLALLQKKRFVGDLVVMVQHGGRDERVSAVVSGNRVREMRWYLAN